MRKRIGKTISYGMTSAGIVVQFHQQRPLDDDWDAMLAAIRGEVDSLRGILIVASGNDGPTPTQRRKVGALTAAYPPTFRGVAMVTDSVAIRGTLAAISSLCRSRFETRAFSSADLDLGLTFLGLDPAQKKEVRVLLGVLSPAQRQAV